MMKSLDYDGQRLKVVEPSQQDTSQDLILLDPKLPKIGPQKMRMNQDLDSPSMKPKKNRIHNMDFFSCLQRARYKNRLSDKEASDMQDKINISANYDQKVILLSKKYVKKEASRVMKLMEHGRKISESISQSTSTVRSPPASPGLVSSHRLLSRSQNSSLSNLVMDLSEPKLEQFEVGGTELLQKINKSINRDQDTRLNKASGKSLPHRENKAAQILRELEKQGKPKPWEVELLETKAYLKFSPNVVIEDPYEVLMSCKRPENSKFDKLKQSSPFLQDLVKSTPKKASASRVIKPQEVFSLSEGISSKEKAELESSGVREVLASIPALHKRLVVQEYPGLFESGELRKTNFKRKAQLYRYFDDKKDRILAPSKDTLPLAPVLPTTPGRPPTPTLHSLRDLPSLTASPLLSPNTPGVVVAANTNTSKDNSTNNNNITNNGPYRHRSDASVFGFRSTSQAEVASVGSKLRLPSLDRFGCRADELLRRIEGFTAVGAADSPRGKGSLDYFD